MSYTPHTNRKLRVLSYFADRAAQFPGLSAALERFFDEPCMDTAREAARLYFKGHRQGDVEPLNKFASAFADKRSTLGIVNSLLEDEEALDYTAARSYPHPIGFDKLVLYHDTETNFKFRLHIYWRGNQRAAMERLHLHRFEMASAIITGELTNHTWGVTEYMPAPANDILPAMALTQAKTRTARQSMHAYSGYWRDKGGVLHKRHLGHCELARLTSDTHISGESYAQILEDAHYVETNAESGLGNGDVCSTIYIHSGGLKDDQGRGMPILFEDRELENQDEIIDTIPNLSVAELKEKLGHYKQFLEANLAFYDWLYDEKHGRNLSVGMIAGYLLAEHYRNPHILSVWATHEKECAALLRQHEAVVRKLVGGEMKLSDIADDDRNKRYYNILECKAKRHPQGKDYWLAHYGDLVREMWRYCGAIKGEKPELTLLKPVWEEAAGVQLPGGAHYGHIAAMLEAAFAVRETALKAHRDGVRMEFKTPRDPVTETDRQIESAIKDILRQHYPQYGFYGEESGNESCRPPQDGDRRFVVDPIDGTRNFANGLDDFATSIACQKFAGGTWVTTDGLVSMPVSGKIIWAEKDNGAYLIESSDTEHKISPPAHNQSPANDNDDPMARALLNYSIRGFGREAEKDMLNYVVDNGISYRVTGSAATMLALCARNDYHAAVITAEEYDVAAGILIAQEAGAMVKSFDFARDGRNFTAFVAARDTAIFKNIASKVERTLGYYTSAVMSPGAGPQKTIKPS